MRAISAAHPTNASSSGSLYDTAVKRWYSTNASAIGPASSGRRKQNTRSHGTNTSSNTVSVSSILCRDDAGDSHGWRSPAEYGLTYIEKPWVSGGSAKAPE